MAFTAKILSWRFRHLNIVGCLIKRRPTKGGQGHPRNPPLVTPLRATININSRIIIIRFCINGMKLARETCISLFNILTSALLALGIKP